MRLLLFLATLPLLPALIKAEAPSLVTDYDVKLESNDGTKGYAACFADYPDGSTLVVGNFISVNSGGQSYPRKGLVKLTPEGLPAPDFIPSFPQENPGWATVLKTGKILVRFDHPNTFIPSEWDRLMPNGTPDPTFPAESKEALFNVRREVTELPDGTLRFFRNAPNSPSSFYQLVRISPDESIEASDPPIPGGTPHSLVTLPNEYSYYVVGSRSGRTLRRYQPNGSLDSTFLLQVGDPSSRDEFNDFVILPGRRFLLAGEEELQITIVDLNGRVDPTFDVGPGADNEINHIWANPKDREIFITGWFENFQGVNRPYFAQLRYDGTIESEFDLGTGPQGAPKLFKKLPNGNILIGGAFNSIDDHDLAGLAVISPVAQNSPPPPEPPSQVSAAAISATVAKLSWQLSDNTDGTLIERKTLPDGPWQTIASLPTSAINHTDLVSPSLSYLYRISAFNHSGESPTEIQIETPPADDLAGQLNPLRIDLLSPTQVDQVYQLKSGKYLVTGRFNWVGGLLLPDEPHRSIVRLNADGTPDLSFDGLPAGISSVKAIKEQNDGKILLGFSASNRDHLIRILPDGALDPDFTPFVFNGSTTWTGTWDVSAIEILDNGNILIGGYSGPFFSDPVDQARHLLILNPDGTLNSSPFPRDLRGSIRGVRSIHPLPDGKYLIGEGIIQSSGQITLFRLNADGSHDPSFSLQNKPSGSKAQIRGIHALPSGDFLLTGEFSFSFQTPDGIGGFETTTVSNLAIIKPDGTTNTLLTSNLGSGTNDEIIASGLLSSGGVFLAGDFTEVNGEPRDRVAIIQPDATLDPTTIDLSPDAIIRSVASTTDGEVLLTGNYSSLGGLPRFGLSLLSGAPLQIDPTFTPNIFLAGGASARALAIEASGSLLVGGSFTGIGIDGTFLPYADLIRILPDGSLDSTFNPTEIDGYINAIAIDSLGDIIVAGRFSTTPDGPLVNIAKLNLAGDLDEAFNSRDKPNDLVNEIIIDDSDRIYLAGKFQNIGGADAINVARLESTGVLDSSFTTPPLSFWGTATTLAHHQGNLFVGFEYNGENKTAFQVFNLDGSFNAELTSAIPLEPGALRSFGSDGLVFGEDFTTTDGISKLGLSSLQLGPPITHQWPSPITRPSMVEGFSKQPGSFYVFGDLFIDGQARSIASISPTTGLTPDFLAGNANGTVSTAALWGDTVVVGGQFTDWHDQPRAGLAFLDANPKSTSLTKSQLTSVTSSTYATLINWQTTPEAHSYLIEGRPTGSENWQKLGYTSSQEQSLRHTHGDLAGTWEYRITAFNSVGQPSAPSTPLISNFYSFDIWKTQRGIPLDISQDDDSDGDSIPLLIEYAFDLDPTATSLLPQPRIETDQFIINPPQVRQDIIYSISQSADLETWQERPLGDPNLSAPVNAALSVSTNSEVRRFIRYTCKLRPGTN